MATAAVKMAWRTEPGSRAVLDIEIPEEDVTQAMDRAYAALVKRVSVPGFRRGKAPRAVLERHLGADALREEALKDLLPERYAQAVMQAGISPVARPSFDVKGGSDGKGLRFTATVEVLPKMSLPDLSAIRVAREAHPVTDVDVDRTFDDLRARHSRLATAEGEAARRGDYVLLKVKSAPAGFERLQPGKEVLVEIGGGLLPAEVETALEGARAGEDRTAQAPAESGTIEVHVADVRRKELPPLDDAFARLVSEEPSLQALRDRIRERLMSERAGAEERDLRERVLDAVLSQTDFDLPESMVQHEMEHTLEDLHRRLRSRGLSLETYLRSQGKDEAGLRADLRPNAERRVRVRLLLDEVAAHEGLTLTEEEMSRAVENLAQESGEEVQKMQAWLAQGERTAGLREHLLRQKAMTVLVAHAAGTSEASEATPTPSQTDETPDDAAG
ncbi:MAG TPA: trigger factor [bacterium]|nr:trigger factor [bacterium]